MEVYIHQSVLALILHRPKYIDWLELADLILSHLTRSQSQPFRRSARAIFASV